MILRVNSNLTEMNHSFYFITLSLDSESALLTKFVYAKKGVCLRSLCVDLKNEQKGSK